MTWILAVAVLAGCGGAEPATVARDYEQALGPLVERLERLDDVNTDPKQVRTAARGFRNAAARLRELEPPADAADELAAVIDALDACANALAVAGKSPAAHDPDARERARDALAAGVRRFTKADRAFQAALAAEGD